MITRIKIGLMFAVLIMSLVSLNSQQPQAPELEVEFVEIDGQLQIRISWLPVENAVSYRVFSSDDPHTDDWGHAITVTSETEYFDDDIGIMKFYYVTASSEDMPPDMFQMVRLRSGEFTTQGDNNNQPAEVTLTREIYVGKYPVTQEEWVYIMNENPSIYSDFYGDYHPVENISWYAAIKFCNLLSIRHQLQPVYSINGAADPEDWGDIPEGPDQAWDSVEFNYDSDGYRLLTDVEWEYAARAEGRENYTFAGSDNSDEVAWHRDNSNTGDGRRTHPVGQKRPNGQGLYDMSGNVREWVWDWEGDPYPSAAIDPTGNPPGRSRVLRGGSYNTVDRVENCAVNFRSGGAPFPFETSYVGLRIGRNTGD